MLDVMCPEGTTRGQDASTHARAHASSVGSGGHAVFLQGVQGQGGPTRRNRKKGEGQSVGGDGPTEREGGVFRGVGLPRARGRGRYIYLLSRWH